jgi:sialate O-acetylesterase
MLNMRSGFLILIIAATVLIQSCSKTEYKPGLSQQTPGGATKPYSGLRLDAVGSSGYYQFIASNDSTAEVANSSVTPGNSFDLAAFAGTPFQEWKITQVSSGNYSIQNFGSGLYLQSYNYEGKEVLIQGNFSGTDAQLWVLTSLAGSRGYKAVNKHDALAITANPNPALQLQAFANLPGQVWNYNEILGIDTVKSSSFTVSTVLQSNMVVQRDKPFVVWGTASPNTSVSVKASWNTGIFTAIADGTGTWQATVPATPVNAVPQTLTASVAGQPVVTLSNILIGDIWLCSGQSNMYYQFGFINGFFPGVENDAVEIAKANHPTLRYMCVGNSTPTSPVDYVTKPNVSWSVTTPAVAGGFSAIGYYFGEKLDSALDIPIGIIVSSLGGSYCEEWTSAQSISSDPVLNAYYAGRNSATEAYNGMIYPLRRLAIKGIVWDQGESNEYDSPVSNYTRLNAALITQWRALFNEGDLPFYFVQMIPTAFTTGNNYFYAEFREAQANIRTTVPKTGMSVNIDINSLSTIHWIDKEPTSDRLARLALHNDYGFPVTAVGPSYKGFAQVKPGVIAIAFNNATTLVSEGPLTQNFYVAGPDSVFYQAQASIYQQYIILTLPAQVTSVASIRFAFTNTAVSNLYNDNGLPVEPFRTDDW